MVSELNDNVMHFPHLRTLTNRAVSMASLVKPAEHAVGNRYAGMSWEVGAAREDYGLAYS